MLTGFFFATGKSPCPALNNAVGSHCGPRSKRNAGYTKFCSGYTIGYTNHPQKAVNRFQWLSTTVGATSQNEAAIVQWIKVEVKKVMVGMERFELSTS